MTGRRTPIVRVSEWLDENGELREDTPRMISEALNWQAKRWANGLTATSEDLSALVGYCKGSRGAISEVLRGNRPVSDDVLLQFARVFGCRFEYLKEIDTFRTDADVLQAERDANRAEKEAHAEQILIEDAERFDAHVRILELLGYSLKPQLYLTGLDPSGWALSKHWDGIKETLTDEALDTPIGDGKRLADWDGIAPIDLGPWWQLPVRKIWPYLSATRREARGKEYEHRSVMPADDTDVHYVVWYRITRAGKESFLNRDQLRSLFHTLDLQIDYISASEFGFVEGNHGKH